MPTCGGYLIDIIHFSLLSFFCADTFGIFVLVKLLETEFKKHVSRLWLTPTQWLAATYFTVGSYSRLGKILIVIRVVKSIKQIVVACVGAGWRRCDELCVWRELSRTLACRSFRLVSPKRKNIEHRAKRGKSRENLFSRAATVLDRGSGEKTAKGSMFESLTDNLKHVHKVKPPEKTPGS